MVGDNVITKNENGVFEFDSTPNTTYNINIFGMRGEFLCNEYITVLEKEHNQYIDIKNDIPKFKPHLCKQISHRQCYNY